jgi:hypothetical protein
MEFVNWTVVTEQPNGFKVGEFVTSSKHDEALKSGWRSREELKKGGMTPTFINSRQGEGQYFVLDQGPNAKKALDFYKMQIAGGEGGRALVSTYAVYWIKQGGPVASYDATLKESPERYTEVAEKQVYYGNTPGLTEHMTRSFDVIFEHRWNSSTKTGPWDVQEAKVNPHAIQHLALLKMKEEWVERAAAKL